jgi:hypothetical protein
VKCALIGNIFVYPLTPITDDCSSPAHWDAATNAKGYLIGEDEMLMDWELSKRIGQEGSSTALNDSEGKTVSLATIHSLLLLKIILRIVSGNFPVHICKVTYMQTQHR